MSRRTKEIVPLRQTLCTVLDNNSEEEGENTTTGSQGGLPPYLLGCTKNSKLYLVERAAGFLVAAATPQGGPNGG